MLLRFLSAALIITVALGYWLVPYVKFSLGNDLYSHVLLIPVVSLYLAWLRRDSLPAASAALPVWSLLPLLGALVALGVRFFGDLSAAPDQMAAVALAYVMLIWAAALATLGRLVLREMVFPLALLLAMVPFPVAVENAIETVLQHGSAECAYWMFRVTGTTVFRDGLVFRLPSIVMEVAPQCSGIRSSLVLFIVSLVGGQLFLQSPWRRVALVAFVIPLALVRNGFRVFTLGVLCERIGPHMIDSWVHHRGGPIFFALSLIPFLAFVWWLMRGEARRGNRALAT